MKAAVKETNSHTSIHSPQGMALQILQKQPFIIWGASLVVALLTGSIALRGLISPGPTESDSPPATIAQTQKPSNEKPAPKPSDAEVEQPANLWLFGAIGLGCAAGSFLIAKRLEQADPQRPVGQKTGAERTQPPTTLMQRAKPAQTASRPARRQKSSAPRVSRRRVPVPSVAVAATSAAPTASGYPAAANPVTEPVVTVVPEHETHPLDWGDASLAEMMDMRKQRPLSHWL